MEDSNELQTYVAIVRHDHSTVWIRPKALIQGEVLHIGMDKKPRMYGVGRD